MNKKKLSVVMAGAMLASSVAPVLAATESELDTSKLGSLVEKLEAKLTEARFDESDKTQANTATGSVLSTTQQIGGKSLYFVKITKNGVVQTSDMNAIYEATVKGSEKTLRTALQDALQKLSVDDEVEIWEVGSTTDKDGKVVGTIASSTAPKYTVADFTEDANSDKTPDIQKAIFDALNTTPSNTNLVDTQSDVVVTNNKVSIKFKAGVVLDNANFVNEYDVTNDGTNYTLTLKVNDNKLDFSKYLEAGEALTVDTHSIATGTAAATVKGFPRVKSTANPSDVAGKLLETITITGTENNFKTEDIYDGLMLTTAGHDLLSLVKAADKKSGYVVAMNGLDGNKIVKGSSTVTLNPNAEGKYGFVISITDKKGNTTKYKVSGAKAQTERVATWFSQRLAKVDILAGDNRYETAVSVAREQLGISKGDLGATANVSNIVLVNGKSLVDGLAASPLAANLKADESGSVAAPILLTEADGLPKATKDFLKELLANKEIGNVNTTIHLVGGTTVLSRELEKELRSYGFDIERYNGANREETSLEVAEKIIDIQDSSATNDRFVVGAEGEADAMSIAPVAAREKTPIIVAKKGGISYQALDELENKDVTVVGGELAFSKEDYEAVEEVIAEKGSVERVAGDNRQQTNAKILEKYYKAGTVDSVIVSKDGKGNNGELVDALTVANLAVQKNAPVVLAKSSLSAEQLNMVNLYGKSSDSLYQVGIGVDRDNVIKVLADRLGLTD